MPKTIVLKDCRISELVLGNKNNYYNGSQNDSQTIDPQREAEDVPYEEISRYCRYIDIEAVNASGVRKVAEIQKMIEDASEKDANEFVKVLRNMEEKKYLNFKGHNKRTVFQNLRADLPMMRDYSESNFYTYF